MSAVVWTAAAAAVIITLVVIAAGLLEPHGAHHGGRTVPESQLLQPRYTARVIYQVPRERQGRPLPPFPGRLALEPVPPPADTGEIPMITAELGMDRDAYLDGLFAPEPAP